MERERDMAEAYEDDLRYEAIREAALEYAEAMDEIENDRFD